MKSTRVWSLAALLGALLLQGCATPTVTASDPRDPWEGMNRRIYAFNDRVDEAVLEPVAKAYVQVLPSFARTGVRNVFGNLADIWTVVNAGLQFKGQVAAETFMRVAINSTLGLYGVLDIASEAGLEKRREDFGQTLGHWGVQPGPYLVLPLFGPSSLRDTAALPADWQAGPGQYFEAGSTRTGVSLLNVTATRAHLLQATQAVKAASLDPYSFVRDAWLQKRQNDVHDGHPPSSSFDYDDPDAP